MRLDLQCCPPNRGCNSPERNQPCVLELCRQASGEEPEIALAVTRWNDLREALERGCGNREARFRRRTFERARSDALWALLMHAPAQAPKRGGRRRRGMRSDLSRARRSATRRDVLLRQNARGGAIERGALR